ncbi:MAG TPA: hypothetical protein DD670_05145 [Planctomycetaceae bacterium]|nr:hypothetical protein [Planctomycetaceae bacterium]
MILHKCLDQRHLSISLSIPQFAVAGQVGETAVSRGSAVRNRGAKHGTARRRRGRSLRRTEEPGDNHTPISGGLIRDFVPWKRESDLDFV